MPGNIGWQGLVIILLVLLVVFGPKRLPELGRSLGRGMREFKDSVTGKDDDVRKALMEDTSPEEDERAALEREKAEIAREREALAREREAAGRTSDTTVL